MLNKLVQKWLKVILSHKMLDNSLFFLYLTSFLAHFEKSKKKLFTYLKTNKSEKKHFKVFWKKNQTYFFSKATFFLFSFFFVSPNLANIRVDFAHLFEFYEFFVLFWKYVIYCKKNQVFIFYIVCTTELRKSYIYRRW